MVINVKEICENPYTFQFWCNYLIRLGIKAGWTWEQIDKEMDVTIDGWAAEYKRIKSQAASQ